MVWGSSKKETPTSDSDGAAPEPAHGSTLRHRKLNPELQKLLDREEEFIDQLYDGHSADSIDTNYRYAAYTTRVRTLLLSAHRYVAYTSDIGESFRPVAHPWLVRSAYGISWAYILGDVANEGYKAYMQNMRVLAPPCDEYHDATKTSTITTRVGEEMGEKMPRVTLSSTESQAHPMPWPDPEADTLVPWKTTKIPLSEDYRSVMAERAIFQVLASMGLPALTIHSVVKYSGRALKGSKSTMIRTWAPIGLGLGVVPFLPYVFDQPVEHGIKWAFRNAFRAIGGEEAVPKPSDDSHGTHKMLDRLEKFKEQKQHEHDIEKPAKEKRQ
ncbi:hypothetical protein FQN55_008253 [Onygenales sp. PD_40]|nr:hypothetical protein FQN55_008253 [Onygenales sp. PD_40]